ncbi:MAG: hypothetical protein P8Z37_05940 [Acidobacteriota bacterium]
MKANIIGAIGKKVKVHSIDTHTLLFLIKAMMAVRTTIPRITAIDNIRFPSIVFSLPGVIQLFIINT